MTESAPYRKLIFSGANSLIYSGEPEGDGEAVVLKMARTDHPTPYQLFLLENEYECTRDLDHRFIRRALALTEVDNRRSLVLEHVPGRTLAALFVAIRQPIETCIRVAICIAEALAAVHEHQIIHRDINPSNILVAGPDLPPSDQELMIKVIDFGIASRLGPHMEHIGNLARLEGTLAYMAPEQTGRMNRRVDHRSDLYSFGVLLYEILAGQPPFTADTPLALAHAHMAINPPPLNEVAPDVPKVLADIVGKLMAKDADNRYQSAAGARYDLQQVADFLANGAAPPPGLMLGRRDVSTRFQLPQRLYGREEELARLLGAFDRTANGAAHLILVSGYSGVGKTALVNEVHKPMTQKNGLFVAGKFDQYQKNIPYFAIKQALAGFCDYLLTEPPNVLATWKQKFLDAAGPNGQILIDIIPQLEPIIGKQPQFVQLGPKETQNRFNFVFQAFFREICAEEHPMVLFIDDLQWADAASFDLLKTLLLDREQHHFLIIGAYRINEVDEGHPLMSFVSQLGTAGVQSETIELANLAETDVNELIADALSRQRADVWPLTNLVYEKTQGNAFFTSQFLNTLHEKSLLTLDATTLQWSWDSERIAREGMTANVVELVAAKIADASESVQRGLERASCIGNAFNLGTLSVITDKPAMQTWQSVVLPALKRQLLVPLDNKYELLGVLEEPDARFKFAHDRVQQAAYSMISPDARTAMHLEIGLRLLAHADRDASVLDIHLFDIVNQLNQGLELVADEGLERRIVKLNSQAAARAKESNAYVPAYQYLETAAGLLGEGGWDTEYDTSVRVLTSMCQLAFLMGHFEAMNAHIDTLLTKGQTALDRLGGYEVRIQHLIAISKQAEALELGLQVLDSLDQPLASELIPGIDSTAILDLPAMSEPVKLAAMRILSQIITPAWAANPSAFERICVTMANISYRHGTCAQSPVGYSFYGGLLCGQGDIQRGYEFGKLAMDLAAAPEAKPLRARVGVLFYATVMHWKKSVHETVVPFYEIFPLAIETGDLEFACYAIVEPDIYSFLMGAELPMLRDKYKASIATLHTLRQDFHCHYLNPNYQAILNLLGENTENPVLLSGEAFRAEEVIPTLARDGHSTLCLVAYQAMTILSFVLCQYEDAYEAACHAEHYKSGGAASGMYFLPVHSFYYSLTLLRRAERATGQERHDYLSKVAENQEELGLWADFAPCNSQHKHDLVAAEMARVKGRMWQACQLYEQAIRAARKNSFSHEHALANELASQCFRAAGLEIAADNYLREAHYAYLSWGAKEKCRRLENDHPWLRRSVRNGPSQEPRGPTTSLDTASAGDSLDLQSALAASQAISREIDLRKLLSTLMEIVVQTAGAERGSLLLPADDRWVVQAEANEKEISVLQGTDADGAELAIEVVHYVARSGDPVVLDDAASEGPFTTATYIATKKVRSLLCVPVLHHGGVSGALYLENNLAAGAFTPARTGLVEMLATQVAISLQNALLYDSLEKRIDERTEQLARAKEEAERARERAEKASQAKSDFLSRMSHELRTPLNGILGYAQILGQDDALIDAHAGGIEVIRQCGEHLITLINDVLDLAKVEAGKLSMQPRATQLRSLLETTMSVVEVRAAKRGIDIVLETEGVPAAVTVDPKRLRQVLLNLLDNAVKFTVRGSVSLRIRQLARRPAAPEAAREMLLRFEVEDTGVGIAPDERERIFRPFEQTGDSAQKTQGTGLGLAISRRLVKEMNGVLQLRSTPGRGSVFWFEVWLPVVALGSEIASATGQVILGYEGSRREILVADDIEHNLSLLDSIFSSLGFVVRTATDGQEAIDEFKRRPPDAIIMDMVMPGVNGSQAMRAIRSTSGGAATPIIATSASTFAHDVEEAISAGANAFVPKPIDISELLSVLSEHLDLEWKTQTARDSPSPNEDVTALSSEVVANIRQALDVGDFGSIEGVARSLEERHPSISRRLMDLARELDGYHIQRLLDRVDGGTG